MLKGFEGELVSGTYSRSLISSLECCILMSKQHLFSNCLSNKTVYKPTNLDHETLSLKARKKW